MNTQDILIREVRENKNSKQRYISVGEKFKKGQMVIIKELNISETTEPSTKINSAAPTLQNEQT